ncbi:MAG: inositol monophosphatase [Candidatus Aenigmarchaeota archaeon]|nr:inositol monophosphatase [Candidatus Aenigmarchaeota archaeon]
MPDPKRALEEALREASRLLRGWQAPLQVARKRDQSSVVTAADTAAEEAIGRILRAAFPADALLGEEKGSSPGASGWTWVVDPLDGTSNFAAALPWYAVLIARVDWHGPALAGIALPAGNTTYLAERGKGAFRDGKPIRVAREQDLANLLVSYSFDSSPEQGRTEREARLMGRLAQRCRNVRSLNCAEEFCLAAEGRLGASVNQNVRVWDIAAPALLLQEAGATVTDAQGNPFSWPEALAHPQRPLSILAANPVVHRNILTLFREG